ncbi:hypothetical protein HYC85_029712 [Camellia sinensis]|uniref:Uncharacterized protein n=1 Tax=Camellia sinensis TaxID=4442 RepID=A0A7J7G012_CAMSI|nr:hypothetical protein HYC85_029712 [Camellia sinensis]
MLASSGKRVDDVMVNVQGNRLKKILPSTDDAALEEIKSALRYFGRPNVQKQGRAAHILLRYEPTYTTFSTADGIPIPSGNQHLSTFLFPIFKSLRQIGLEDSDSGQDVEPVVEVVAEPTREVPKKAEEVDEAIRSAFEVAGFNQPSPSTSGRAEFSSGDIFANLGDLPDNFSEGMAGESLTHMSRKKNTERMVARKKAEAAHSEPTVIKTFIPVIEETAQERGKKRSGEGEAGSEISPASKWPRLEESDVVAPFIVRQKIKDTPISSDASAIEDPAVALSLAASISLPADTAAFRAVSDVMVVALSTQSVLLTVGRIADLGRRLHDALGRIDRLQTEADGQKSRAEFEVMRAAMESARAEAEEERARSAEQLRSDAESRANTSEESVKLAKEALAKVKVQLEELKAAKEKADSEASAAFEAGKSAAYTEYVDEVPKFENRGFKHGWLKALATAGVTLALPIPYEQVDVEPLESDPED